MRIVVLGAGGIGGFYGGVLARAGHCVNLLARGDNLAALQDRGLEVRIHNDPFIVRVKASDNVEEFGAVDWAILAVKSYSIGELVPTVQRLASRGAFIVSLLNGLDTPTRLIECGLPADKLLCGVTVTSAHRIGPGVVQRHGELQRLILGQPFPAGSKKHMRSERAAQIADAFRRAGVEAQLSNDIQTDLWRKFAFLAPVAALCGMTRSPIGPIRRCNLGRLLLRRSIHEVIDVGIASGVAFTRDEVSDIIEFCDSLPEDNKPSLLRDVEAGNRTEIDELSGAVSRRGDALGVDTPIHDAAFVAISLASRPRHTRQSLVV